MDYLAFCRNYYAISQIPMTLVQGGTAVYSSAAERLGIPIAQPMKVFWENDDVKTNPSICGYSPEIEYGAVHVEGTDYYVVLGPVFRVPVTDTLVYAYIRENQIPGTWKEEVAEFLSAIPLTSQSLFHRHLSLLHMSLNNADVSIEEQIPMMLSPEQRRSNHLKSLLETIENGQERTTYRFEKALFQTIAAGDTNALKVFLEQNALDLPEGCLASTPMRHAKNLFIITAAKVGLEAGIPAGIHVDTVYQLTEMYIQECEKLQTLGEVQSLQYAMLMDFCRRCGENRLPSGISEETNRCLSYIQNHITEPIRISDLTELTGRSGSYLNKCFQAELGMSINSTVTHYKLERAKNMLTYGNASLCEISCFLGFSSQSYFQNVFRKQYGITPLKYRNESRKR